MIYDPLAKILGEWAVEINIYTILFGNIICKRKLILSLYFKKSV